MEPLFLDDISVRRSFIPAIVKTIDVPQKFVQAEFQSGEGSRGLAERNSDDLDKWDECAFTSAWQWIEVERDSSAERLRKEFGCL